MLPEALRRVADHAGRGDKSIQPLPVGRARYLPATDGAREERTRPVGQPASAAARAPPGLPRGVGERLITLGDDEASVGSRVGEFAVRRDVPEEEAVFTTAREVVEVEISGDLGVLMSGCLLTITSGALSRLRNFVLVDLNHRAQVPTWTSANSRDFFVPGGAVCFVCDQVVGVPRFAGAPESNGSGCPTHRRTATTSRRVGLSVPFSERCWSRRRCSSHARFTATTNSDRRVAFEWCPSLPSA